MPLEYAPGLRFSEAPAGDPAEVTDAVGPGAAPANPQTSRSAWM